MFSSRIKGKFAQLMEFHRLRRTLFIVLNICLALSVLFMSAYSHSVSKVSKVSVFTDGLTQMTTQLQEQRSILSPEDSLRFQDLIASAMELYGDDGELNPLDILLFDFNKLVEMNYFAANLLYSLDVDEDELAAAVEHYMSHLSRQTYIELNNRDNSFRENYFPTVLMMFFVAYHIFMVIELFQKKRSILTIALSLTVILQILSMGIIASGKPINDTYDNGDYQYAVE